LSLRGIGSTKDISQGIFGLHSHKHRIRWTNLAFDEGDVLDIVNS
jgi:hypothetical protein